MNTEMLKKIRKEKGFTQEELGKKLGYKGKSGYSIFESGKIKVDVEKSLKIKEILDLTQHEYSAIFLGK